MKSWELNRRVNSLSQGITDPAKTETRIDITCLSEPERQLFIRINEIMEEFKPANPPDDVIEKNADLWNKGLEIFCRRTTELFVHVVPASLCCDELEEWYFKIYFYNFWLDWIERVKEVRNMPKKHREELIAERKEMGLLDVVFRFPKTSQGETETQSARRAHQP
jgi:hypothetical protein